jgi:hypothetical protein
MTCTAWRLRMPGFLLLLDACSEGPVAKAGYRFFPRHWQTRFPLWPTCNPCFVRLHGTAATHEIDIPTTSLLVTSDLATFFTETFRILATGQIRTGREGAT